VTGATGFFGSHLVGFLVDLDAAVVILTRDHVPVTGSAAVTGSDDAVVWDAAASSASVAGEGAARGEAGTVVRAATGWVLTANLRSPWLVLLCLTMAQVGMMSMMGVMTGTVPAGMSGTGWCGFAPFGGIVLLVLAALIAAGLVALIVWLARQNGQTATSSTHALDSLRERYARGEISHEQFDEMKAKR